MHAEIKIAVLILFGVFWPIALFAQAELIGQITHVRDGDTIEVGDIAIRLNGLTCEEHGTDLGDRATAHLRSQLQGNTATCSLTGERTYDRLVGRCMIEELGDIGAHLITQQLCGRCERYDPEGEYAQAQRNAGPFAGAIPSYCKSQ